MTYIDIGSQGAKRQQSHDFNIRLFIAKLLADTPTLGVEAVSRKLAEYVEEELADGNDDPLRAVCDHAASNNFMALRQPKTSPPRTPTAPNPAARDKIVRRVRANILQSVVMPSGRTLYDSTREEIIEHHGNLTVLIEKLRPGQTPRQAGITTLEEARS